MRKPPITLFIFICLFATLIAYAQSPQGANSYTAFELGAIDHIKSAELGETRTLNIYFPPGYNTKSDTACAVIYLLDGGADEDFIHITGIVQFLTQIVDTMPRAIVVGITNVDRKRDFTFCHALSFDGSDIPTSGGSAKFIAFIEKELQPYMQKKYKANKSKTLIGQSLGGLLATEILLKKPELFDNYLIVSPSLWWNKESLLKESQQGFSNKIRVCIAVGAEGDMMEGDAKKLLDLLAASGKGNMEVSYLSMPDENHLTILHNAAYKGFEILFSAK